MPTLWGRKRKRRFHQDFLKNRGREWKVWIETTLREDGREEEDMNINEGRLICLKDVRRFNFSNRKDH